MAEYVIIGTGAAGVAAVEAIRSLDMGSQITMIQAEKAGYYSRPGLAYYLTGELAEKSLYPFYSYDFRRLKVEIVQGWVEFIDNKNKQVVLYDGRRIDYYRTLIAVGASAVKPSLPGDDLEGVVYLDSLGSTRMMIRQARKARTAVVVGGGITALEMVEGFCARGIKVHFLLRKDRYWGNVLDETESRIVEERLKEDGVQIHYYTEIEEILGKRKKVTGVVTKDGNQIKCQLVGFAIGVRPRLGLAKNSGLDTERGILVNQFLETSEPGVYAAGDVAQVYDPNTKKSVVDSLWNPARQQGHIAGLNMAGASNPYIKEMPYNVTRLAGLTTTIIGTVGTQSENGIGIVRGESETWHHIPEAIACQNNFEVNHLRLFVAEKEIVGAVVMGNQTLSSPLQHMILNKIDITPIREKLLGPDPPIAEIIGNFWASRRPNGQAKKH